MRAKDVAKEKDWGSNFEVRECPADLASDPDIPVVLTMLSNAAGGWGQCGFACGPARAPSGLLSCPAECITQCGIVHVHVLCAGQRSGAGAKSSNQAIGMHGLESALQDVARQPAMVMAVRGVGCMLTVPEDDCASLNWLCPSWAVLNPLLALTHCVDLCAMQRARMCTLERRVCSRCLAGQFPPFLWTGENARMTS